MNCLKCDREESILMYHDLILSIVATMEARDSYTASHSMRVADMTEQICDLMKLPFEEKILLHIAAHIHDIGKIGIEDAVLRKKERLTDEEWEKVKEHPYIGFTILSSIRSFKKISEIVLHHHERWDGRGYPGGLKELEIPMGARIIAIADSIDAMMSNRSYRKSMRSEVCREEIRKNSGIMYDPQIANIVLHNWEAVLLSRSA